MGWKGGPIVWYVAVRILWSALSDQTEVMGSDRPQVGQARSSRFKVPMVEPMKRFCG